MRPVEFGEDLLAGTRLTLFSDDKPDRYFTVLESMLESSIGVPSGDLRPWPAYHVLDEEEREHLLVNEPDEHEWWLWRSDLKQFDSRSIFTGALIEEG
jgi:hypothetical protein